MAPWRERRHEIIFEADTPAGKAFDIALLLAILLSVAVVMLESVESINDRYNYCRAPIHRSHVRMLRRHSDSGCTYDRDWGYDSRGVWVENGCRATFEIE